ncbi:MAG: GGDEF domain-containing protein [Spirochaetales bacterium]|nr:GGDEF domain-containing protein [Spirochaetales bacterium]
MSSLILYLAIDFKLEGKWLDLFNFNLIVLALEKPLIIISVVYFFFQKCFKAENLKKYRYQIVSLVFIPYVLFCIVFMVRLAHYGVVKEASDLPHGYFIDWPYKLFLLYYMILIFTALIASKKHFKTIKRSEYITYVVVVLILFVGEAVDSIHTNIKLEWGFVALAYWILFIFNFEKHVSSDSLTEVYNRQSYELMLSKLWFDTSAEKRAKQFYFMLNLDKVKHLNEIYGPLMGDKALKILTKEVLTVIKDYDSFFARIGGDEFCIIIENIDKECAHEIKRQIKARLTNVSLISDFSYPLSVSIGIVCFEEVDSLKMLDEKARTQMMWDKKLRWRANVQL